MEEVQVTLVSLKDAGLSPSGDACIADMNGLQKCGQNESSFHDVISPRSPTRSTPSKIAFATLPCASSFSASLDGGTPKTPVCRFPLTRLIA
jgi:hypothetical protein